MGHNYSSELELETRSLNSDHKKVTSELEDKINKDELAQEHGGMKFCKGKTRLGLLMKGFAPAIQEVGIVSTKGAEKYEADSWQTVPDAINKYRDALYRHLLAWDSGEENDPEFGTHHLAHAAWNCLALLTLILKG